MLRSKYSSLRSQIGVRNVARQVIPWKQLLLSRTGPMLVRMPAATWGIRSFSESRAALLKSPTTSRFSQVFQVLPQAVKKFLYFTLGAGILVVLTPALMLLIFPPLIVGGFYVWRNVRKLKAQAEQNNWSDFQQFHVMPEQSSLGRVIPAEARIRLTDAIYNNERDLGDILNPYMQQISFGPAESFQQDMRMSSQGLQENIHILIYPIYVNNKQVATVEVRGRQMQGDSMRAKLTVFPRHSSKKIVLDWTKNDDSSPRIIDVRR